MECRYCHADLGTVWLVNASPLDDTEFITQFQTNYLETDIGRVVIRLMASQALQTQLTPGDISRIVSSILAIPLAAEVKRVASGADAGAASRLTRERFLTLSATISVLHALSLGGAPLLLDQSALEALLAKEYLDLLQHAGLLPSASIQVMYDLWPKTLVHHLPNAAAAIANSVKEIGGAKEEALLARFYALSLAYPITLRRDVGLSTALATATTRQPVKTRDSAARYAAALVSAPIAAAKRQLPAAAQRVAALNPSRMEPKLAVPARVPPLVRITDIGRAQLADPEEAFAETVLNVCPELLLHPQPGSAIFASGRDHAKDGGVSGDASAGIYAERVSLGSHRFAAATMAKPAKPSAKPPAKSEASAVSEASEASAVSEERHCIWCGIAQSMQVKPEYYTRYHRVIEELETKSAAFFDCTVTSSPTAAPAAKQEPVQSRDVASIQREFSKRFEWYAGLDLRIIGELASIVSSIGFYDLGLALRRATSADVKPLASETTTAWHIFMSWALRQKEELARRTVERLRAARAIA